MTTIQEWFKNEINEDASVFSRANHLKSSFGRALGSRGFFKLRKLGRKLRQLRIAQAIERLAVL
jgi:hypothetical protein